MYQSNFKHIVMEKKKKLNRIFIGLVNGVYYTLVQTPIKQGSLTNRGCGMPSDWNIIVNKPKYCTPVETVWNKEQGEGSLIF